MLVPHLLKIYFGLGCPRQFMRLSQKVKNISIKHLTLIIGRKKLNHYSKKNRILSAKIYALKSRQEKWAQCSALGFKVSQRLGL